jgi:hypothetical protein
MPRGFAAQTPLDDMLRICISSQVVGGLGLLRRFLYRAGAGLKGLYCMGCAGIGVLRTF